LLTQLYDKCSMRREWGSIIWRLIHVLFGALPESVRLSTCLQPFTCSNVRKPSRKKVPKFLQGF
jgi:hypothetical protein